MPTEGSASYPRIIPGTSFAHPPMPLFPHLEKETVSNSSIYLVRPCKD